MLRFDDRNFRKRKLYATVYARMPGTLVDRTRFACVSTFAADK